MGLVVLGAAALARVRSDGCYREVYSGGNHEPRFHWPRRSYTDEVFAYLEVQHQSVTIGPFVAFEWFVMSLETPESPIRGRTRTRLEYEARAAEAAEFIAVMRDAGVASGVIDAFAEGKVAINGPGRVHVGWVPLAAGAALMSAALWLLCRR